MKKADVSKFDPNSAGSPDSNVFGLNFSREESNIVLVPVPWEATTSYGRGTVHGPQAIREASPQLDLFDADLASFGMTKPWEFGIYMDPISDDILNLNGKACELALPIIEKGGEIAGFKKLEQALGQVNELSGQLNAWVYDSVKSCLAQKKIPGVIGGDHSVSFGAIKACAEMNEGLGILHIDAHADLRVAYEGFEYSHASIMENVVRRIPQVGKLVQVGIRDFSEDEYVLATTHPIIQTHFDFQLKEAMYSGTPWGTLCERIVESLPSKVYVSFDIDGLEPWLCPSTGTPVAGGLTYTEALYLLKTLLRKNKTIVGFDLNEVAPGKDANDQWNGNVGARVLYRLCGVALASQGAKS